MSADTARRLASLADYDILDTPPEQDFDDVVELACAFCATPIALVSLVTDSRQWFKARVGLAICETPLDQSICRHGLSSRDLLVIPDLTLDPRTAASPLVVEDPSLRFYAGAPLVTEDGVALGMLCVMDHAPRPDGLTELQATALRRLARQVMALLVARRAVEGRNAFIDRQQALLDLGEHMREAPTPQALMAAIAEALGKTLGASRAGHARIDLRAGVIVIEQDWRAEGQESLVGAHATELFANTDARLAQGETVVVADVPAAHWLAEDRFGYAALDARALIASPLMERGELVGVLFVHDVLPRVWTREEIAFVHAAADRAYWALAKAEADERQQVLNLEISHRLKNTLAMVQAIALQSLKGVKDREAVRVFEQRVQALSAAHDVLLQAAWSETELRLLIGKVLTALGQEDRVTLTGPPVLLGSRATLAASLLVHELATNALKYGALSSSGGTVRLSWSIEAGDLLVLSWVEAGGPPATPPKRAGFGSRLIRSGLGVGGARLSYGETGFSAEFRTPLSQIQRD